MEVFITDRQIASRQPLLAPVILQKLLKTASLLQYVFDPIYCFGVVKLKMPLDDYDVKQLARLSSLILEHPNSFLLLENFYHRLANNEGVFNHHYYVDSLVSSQNTSDKITGLLSLTINCVNVSKRGGDVSEMLCKRGEAMINKEYLSRVYAIVSMQKEFGMSFDVEDATKIKRFDSLKKEFIEKMIKDGPPQQGQPSQHTLKIRR